MAHKGTRKPAIIKILLPAIIIMCVLCGASLASPLTDSLIVEDSLSLGGYINSAIAFLSRFGLNEAAQNALYTRLSQGETVKNGSTGENAAALQELLNAFNEEVVVDGAVGAKTIVALSSVVNDFYGEQASMLTDALYERLMFALVAAHDDAYATMIFPPVDAKLTKYVRAVGLLRLGKRYEARLIFTELGDYKDALLRVADCAVEIPPSGETYRAVRYANAACPVIVTANRDDGSATFVRITSGDEVAAELIMRGSESATTHLTPGFYVVYVATGSKWYGLDAFGGGDDASYMRLVFDGENGSFEARDGYKAMISLEASEAEGGDTSASASGIGFEEFVGIAR